MTAETILDTAEIADLVADALARAGTAVSQARAVAEAVAADEADGRRDRGLDTVPAAIEHLRTGRARGNADAAVDAAAPAVLRADAGGGFLPGAAVAAIPALEDAARREGTCLLTVRGGVACGTPAAALHTLAAAGLVALGFDDPAWPLGARASRGVALLAVPHADGPTVLDLGPVNPIALESLAGPLAGTRPGRLAPAEGPVGPPPLSGQVILAIAPGRAQALPFGLGEPGQKLATLHARRARARASGIAVPSALIARIVNA